MVKVEVGKWYKTRDGRNAYVFGRMLSQDAAFPFFAEMEGRYSFAVTPAGSFYTSEQNNKDLVEYLPDCDSFTWEPPKPPQYRDAVASDVTWPWSEVWVGNYYSRKTYLAGMSYDAEGKPIYITTDGKTNAVCKVKL